ncbi:MAG: hypothetical protein JO153_14030 [Solirubrobacterales bacterium]|nr:hypothetical protein [Solirubrobacterales bacterium]MBV9917619.1 hypothetical protein [Solirubrobacterales bacterium]
MTASHQTVRLARGRHPSPRFGACVMELASMLADERFSDRPASVSPVIGAFLRTYNDGIDDERRQDLYPLASLIVGTAGSRRVERERASRCLEFARSLGAGAPSGRAAVGIANADASGSWAALAALRADPSGEPHARVLAFARELVGIEAEGPRRGWWFWRLGRDPGHAVEQALRDDDAASAPAGKMTPASWTT